MNNKNIVLILGFISIILIVGFFILLSSRDKEVLIEAPLDKTNPTGIILPKDKLAKNELDVISLNIPDNSSNIPLDNLLEITFSRNLQPNEIEIDISPEILFSTEISKDKFKIVPIDSWAGSTRYYYSVNFVSDSQKVRLYSFETVGNQSVIAPDTYSENLYDDIEESTRRNDPDIYLINHVPFENEYFKVTGNLDLTPPSHYFFTISPLNTNENLVRQSVQTWLQFNQLTNSQIESLDVRYK